MTAADLTARITAALDEAVKALTWTSSRGRWEAHRSYAFGSRRALVVHQPTGDTLGEFVHPADMEHAVLWQPSRVQALIDVDRRVLDRHQLVTVSYGDDADVSCKACGEITDGEPCRDVLDLAARWGVTP